MFNNDKILGDFLNGQPNGLVLIKWAASKTFRERYAKYQRGVRQEWAHENTAVLRKLNRLLSQSFQMPRDDDDVEIRL
jgi:hypothetical protein